jgi:hypothetical protein
MQKSFCLLLIYSYILSVASISAERHGAQRFLSGSIMGVNMNEVVMLRGAEPREILETAISEQVPAIMSYLSKGKWHVAKVLLTDLGANKLSVEPWPHNKPHPINIHINQPVGVSLKYGYGKFVFDTTVVGLEPSSDPRRRGQSGTIILAVPDRIEIVQRRSYYRVDVPQSLKVNVLLWHRGHNHVPGTVTCGPDGLPENSEEQDYYKGRLVDISAGGAQIALDASEKPDLKKGQFIGLTFTPMPYERPLMFDAQIRNILPTADNKNICLGLQIVGLEASAKSRQVLQRLCEVVEHYFQINQSGAKHQEMQGASKTIKSISESDFTRTD